MTVYRFQEITRRAKKRVTCGGCGKKMTRQTTFMQTLNPFNKNADGDPKTVQEIHVELGKEAADWESNTKGYLCVKCEFPESA